MKALKILALIAFCTFAAGLATQTAQAGTHKFDDRGSIWANGTGTFHLVGKGHTVINGFGRGVIEIRNYKSSDVEIDGKYDKKRVGKTLYIYNLKGKVTLSGRKLDVRFIGGQTSLRANIKGTVYLRGMVRYSIDNGTRGWACRGVRLELKSKPKKIIMRRIEVRKPACKKMETKKYEINKKQNKKHQTRKIETKKRSHKKQETKKQEHKEPEHRSKSKH